MLDCAAARLTMPSACTSEIGMRSIADPEILARALGLRAPIAVGGDLDRAEGVGLGAGRGAGGLALGELLAMSTSILPRETPRGLFMCSSI